MRVRWVWRLHHTESVFSFHADHFLNTVRADHSSLYTLDAAGAHAMHRAPLFCVLRV